ncbi:hypothetical protein SAY86_002515 [Trapa natans]|uniref:NAC domain-containing protein n=1 Tax=Trapa natans TaxID=22666 RepID=A0AAN7LT67_TRANT|nr:hypothetical protein SAY86_002515 [Trapa natans]
MGGGSGTSLAPGFRFHPTDEELVRYYLKRKVSGKPLRYDPISEVDVYKCEPWDLPDKSRLKTRDLEWYFFSVLDKKYGNGSKTNRATENGYWKTTGKDRQIRHSTRVVGMKKTLVYHRGRAPRGLRSNWVMHEYRMTDEELEKAGIAQDAFVLCRIFQKSGPGPKNGEQYGAPFVEEEWEEDDAMALFPEQQAMLDETVVDENDTVETEINQDVTVPAAPGSAAHPINFCSGSTSYGDHCKEANEQVQMLPKDVGESKFEDQQSDENKFFALPNYYEMDVKPVKKEFAVQPTDDMNLGDYVREFEEEPISNPLAADDAYLNDDSYPLEYPEGFNVEDYLTFFDTDEDNLITPGFSHFMTRNDGSVYADPLPSLEGACCEIEGPPETDLYPLVSREDNEASSSNQKPEPKDDEQDFKHGLLKQASHMLGSFPAPPAYASQYPIKDASLRLNSTAHSPSSVHVTAGMMRIRSLTLISGGMGWSPSKHGEFNLILSIEMSLVNIHPTAASAYTSRLISNKMSSIIWWNWLLFLVFWILILSVSIKVGLPVYPR